MEGQETSWGVAAQSRQETVRGVGQGGGNEGDYELMTTG